MLRYHSAFATVASWCHSGFLGEVFKIRADMSKGGNIPESYPHLGGIGYDLGSHMLDQIIWMMGPDRRPTRVSGFAHATQSDNADYPDNTVGIFEWEGGEMAVMDISLRTVGSVRRFEVRLPCPGHAALAHNH